MSLHFPLPKIRTFRFFLHTSHLSLRGEVTIVIENLRQMIKSCPVLFVFPSKKLIKLIPKTIGNRKRDYA